MDEMKAISESDNEVIADLRRIVGVKNTAEIVKQCGGAFLYIPLMKSLVKEERDKAIYSDYLSGASYKEIALKHSLATATVRDIINNERKLEHGRTEKQRSGAVRIADTGAEANKRGAGAES